MQCSGNTPVIEDSSASNCYDKYANCSDTDGSFKCTCNRGFTENGVQCSGNTPVIEGL